MTRRCEGRTNGNPRGPNAGPKLLDAVLNARDKLDAVRRGQASGRRELSSQSRGPLVEKERDKRHKKARRGNKRDVCGQSRRTRAGQRSLLQ
eukprot:2887919-Alexandrium_andersonii.AAC.1